MRKKEQAFASPNVLNSAHTWGRQIQAARLARNLTQTDAAERGRMSLWTWLKIEKGEVSVSMASWLAAFEVVGLLAGIAIPDDPSLPAAKRLRANPSRHSDEYDF